MKITLLFFVAPFLFAGCSAPDPAPPVAPTPIVIAVTATPAPTAQTSVSTATPQGLAQYRLVFDRVTTSVRNAAQRYEAVAVTDKSPATSQEMLDTMRTDRDLAGEAALAAKSGLDDLGTVTPPQNLQNADSLLRQGLGQYQTSMITQQHYWDNALSTGGVDRTTLNLGIRQTEDANALLGQAMDEYRRVTGAPTP